MKEITILFSILIIIIGGNFALNKYLRKSSQSLIKDLEKLEKEIKQEKINEDLINHASKIYDKWKKTEKTWAIFVLHSELDSIETSLIKMKTQIEENNLDISLEELETSIFLVKHISEKEKFCIKNVF